MISSMYGYELYFATDMLRTSVLRMANPSSIQGLPRLCSCTRRIWKAIAGEIVSAPRTRTTGFVNRSGQRCRSLAYLYPPSPRPLLLVPGPQARTCHFIWTLVTLIIPGRGFRLPKNPRLPWHTLVKGGCAMLSRSVRIWVVDIVTFQVLSKGLLCRRTDRLHIGIIDLLDLLGGRYVVFNSMSKDQKHCSCSYDYVHSVLVAYVALLDSVLVGSISTCTSSRLSDFWTVKA